MKAQDSRIGNYYAVDGIFKVLMYDDMKKQDELIAYWTKNNYFVINNIRTNKTGLPDLTATKPDHVVFIESKEDNDSLSANQIARLNQLHSRGFDCYVNYEKWAGSDRFDTDIF